MDLLAEKWLQACTGQARGRMSPCQVGEAQWRDIGASRPDFRGALYQFLIGLLQTAYAPADLEEWRDRWRTPPTAAALEAAFAPYRRAFLLESDGPAFMQDLALPSEANHLPVLELLIDAGSDSNRYFNKPAAEHGLCASCFAQALLTLQLNAPAGGRGVRTSLRGGGPLTTLLLPTDDEATLWQRLWLNVIPLEALDCLPVKAAEDVIPWLLPTRISEGPGAIETHPQLDRTRQPQQVHPLQAYWSMPRRIRMDSSTCRQGDCAVCGEKDQRLIQHYRSRHGGTNYAGDWMHPLTPYSLDPKAEKPPLSVKGRQAGRGYRDWLGLVLGNDDHQPDAARVVRHFTAKVRQPATRLWCFGYDMSNMKALCWYDATLPVHAVAMERQASFRQAVKQLLDVASEAAISLHKQVRAAWFRRPGDAGLEPAIAQSFWQRSEAAFYERLEVLSALDFERPATLAGLYRGWLLETRRLAFELFDHWVLSAPIEDMELQRVVRARADLVKELNSGKAAKALWKLVDMHRKEDA
jgi:CRISPR system Cascade subunit CasA